MNKLTSKTSRKPAKLLKKPSLPNIHYVHPIIYSELHPVNISVAGCGGTGSMVLRDLARMHTILKAMQLPGLHVSAYDPDVFTASNYGRQLMTEDDIGASKAICLIERINRVYGLQWNGYKKRFRLKSPGDGKNPTILITAVDSIEARKQCTNQRWANTTDNVGGFQYWIDAGNGNNFGQVLIGTSKQIKQPKSKLYNTIANLPSPMNIYKGVEPDIHEPSCSIAQALGRQDLMINSMMSQIICQLIWSMIRNKYLTIRGAYLNLETLTMRPVLI